MSTWANRARAHFLQERQNSTTETTETPCIFTQERPKHTTETTETPLSMVLTVQSGRFCKKHDICKDIDPTANDPAPTPIAATVDGNLIPQKVRQEVVDELGKTPDLGTIRPPGLTPKLLSASLARDAQIHAAGSLPGNDPDRWCYPASTAMTGREIDTIAARLARFTVKGMIHADAESMADRLLQRDRDSDDRRLCLECTHLGGYGPTSWRCGNWRAAGVAHRAQDNKLPADLVLQLQRCDGFIDIFKSTMKSTS